MPEILRKYKYILTAAALFFLLALIYAAGIGKKAAVPVEEMNTYSLQLYYLNRVSNTLEPEERDILAKNNEEAVQMAVYELMEGSKSTNLSRSVPAFDEQISVQFGDGIAVVDFPEQYLTLSAIDATFCRSAIVWTLTGFDFIDRVLINVNGEPLKKSDGQEFGYLSRENVLINPEISHEPQNTKTVNLYFADSQFLGLVGEERTIDVNPDSIEKSIIEQLIAGPESDKLYPLMPVDTKLREVMTSDSVCYVDFSKDFVDKFIGGSSEARLLVYSIVNSITETTANKQVVFLVEGERVTDFKGIFDLSTPFEADTAMILEEES